MPGYVIHLAIGKRYIEKNNIKDEENFLKGCIAPDLLDKSISHYGKKTDNPNFKRFLAENSLNSEYNQGYLLHLISDYLYYNKYLNRFVDKFCDEIYHDYNKLNEMLIKKYNIEIPKEIQAMVGIEEGEPNILNYESICKFIEAISSINFTQIKSLSDYLSSYEMFEEKEKIEK